MKRVKGYSYLYQRGDQLAFRRVVPVEAREAFGGKTTVQVSLGAISLAQARPLLLHQIEKFERMLTGSRHRTSGSSPLSNLSQPTPLHFEEAVRAWFEERTRRYYVPYDRLSSVAQLADLEELARQASGFLKRTGPLPLMATWIAETLAERSKWRIEDGSQLEQKLQRLVCRGIVEAATRQSQEIDGDPIQVLDQTFSPDQYRVDAVRQLEAAGKRAVPLSSMFESYVAERKPAPATVKSYRRQLAAFVKHLGHDDASKIEPTDVVRWKDHLLTVPNGEGRVRSAKTVSDGYLAPLKTVLGWGFDNHQLQSNPAERVRVRVPRKDVLRDEKGLNDAEALTILRATLQPQPQSLTEERLFARRWIPWLCAFTGARIDEMAQLRAEDVSSRRGVWTVRITPEAGATKDRKARIVGLHPQLIDQGFVSALAGRSGHLFYNPTLHRGGSNANPQSKKVGQHIAKWVRMDLKVNDPLVQPNHGWRHRFKSQARLFNMDPEVREYIQGHATKTEGANYGDTFPEVTLREISKLPWYDM